MIISHPYRLSNYFDNCFTPLIKYKEIDRLFDTLFEPITLPSYSKGLKRNREQFYVEENDHEVNIIGALPNNYNKDLIKIEIENEKNGDKILHIGIKYKKNKRDFRGRVISSYQSEQKQSFSLDRNVFDFERIKAKIEDGKLYINLPRKDNKEEIIPIQYITKEKEENNKVDEEDEIPVQHTTNEDGYKEEDKVEMEVETNNEEDPNDSNENNTNESFKVKIEDEEMLDSQEEEEEIAIVSDVD